MPLCIVHGSRYLFLFMFMHQVLNIFNITMKMHQLCLIIYSSFCMVFLHDKSSVTFSAAVRQLARLYFKLN